MAELRIRNVDDDLKFQLRQEAKASGMTMEEFARRALKEAAFRRRRKMGKEMRALREKLFEKYGLLEDSTIGIREDRDSRG